MRIDLFPAAGPVLGRPSAAGILPPDLNRRQAPFAPVPQHPCTPLPTPTDRLEPATWPGAKTRPASPTPPMPSMGMSNHRH